MCCTRFLQACLLLASALGCGLPAGAQPAPPEAAAASAPASAPASTPAASAASAGEPAAVPVVRIQGRRERHGASAEPAEGYLAGSSGALGVDLPLQQLPATVNAISAELIKDLHATRLSGLAGWIPGLLAGDADDTVEDALLTRGFEADVLTNGLIHSLPRPMPDNIERVEITKGPADTEFGIAEPGGTINLITKKPQRGFAAEASASIGNFGYRKLGLDLTGALNRTASLQARFIAAGEQAARWRRGRPGEIPRSLIAPSLNWDYSEAGNLLLEYQRYTQNDPQDFGIVYLEGAFPGGFAPRDWSFHQRGGRNEQKTDSLDLQWNHRFTPGLNAKLHWLRARDRYRVQEFRTADSEPGGVLYNDDGRSWSGVRRMPIFWADWGPGMHRVHNLQASLTGRRQVGETEQVLTVGAARQLRRLAGTAVERELETDNTIDILAPDNDQTPNIIADDGVRRTSRDVDRRLGVYAQWLGQWSPRWRTVIGLRRERDTESTVTALNQEPSETDSRDERVSSWRLASSFDLSPAHTVYAGYADAQEPQDGTTRAGARVPPLHAKNVELGLKTSLRDGALRWTNTAFHVVRNNASIADPANTPTEDFVIPFGRVRVRGFESELLGRLAPALQVSAGLAYLDSRITENAAGLAGKRFANTPRWQASVLGAYRWSAFGMPALRTVLGAVHVSERAGNSDNNIRLPGYTLVNAGISVALSQNANFELHVSNLFDRTYYSAMQDEPVSPGQAGKVTVGDRRLISATLSIKY